MNEGQLNALLHKLSEISSQQRETNALLRQLVEQRKPAAPATEAVRAAPKHKRASRAKAKENG